MLSTDYQRGYKKARYKIWPFSFIIIFLIMLLASSTCFADFSFIVMGDSRGNDRGINEEIFRRILERITSDEPDFIVFVGDLITGSKHKDEHKKRLLKWKEIVGEFDIKTYIAIGNHEITSETSEGLLRSIFEMPKNGPTELKELVYSFDYKNAHFIVVDTNHYKDFHSVGSSQLEWLKNDLEKNKKRLIFVFGHEPAFPVHSHIGSSLDRYPSKRDELWDIFKGYGVSIYFCGHEHLYDKSIHDGVCQVVTGGSGARLYSRPEKGGFYHYVTIYVKDDGKCEIRVKGLDGEIKDRFNIDL